MTSVLPAADAPLPIYLGPTLPRWQPRTMDDVRTAITDGTLAERHWLDVKEKIDSGPQANMELGRDLASFANDGGGYVIGVAEDRRTQVLTLAPVALAGLAERVDQVARSRCDPPLYVQCHPLVDPAKPTHGVLLVEIPPSPLAPHMVDGAYHGRSDKTKHRLNDAEVARLHARRTSRQATGEQLVERELRRSPIPQADRTLSRLYVVAQPLASPPDLLTATFDKHDFHMTLRAHALALPNSQAYAPRLTSASNYEPRPRGVALYTPGLVGRMFQPGRGAGPEDQLDLEIADSGEVTLFCSRASLPSQDNRRQHVHSLTVVALTHAVATLAGKLGGDYGYAGSWLLSVGVTNLAGKYAIAARNFAADVEDYPAYSEDVYIQATEAMTVELLKRPYAPTSRLMHRLLRGLHEQRDSLSPWLDAS